jgi:murein DD-endopeptidase MepM/ murein hydrolase activator NlpD
VIRPIPLLGGLLLSLTAIAYAGTPSNPGLVQDPIPQGADSSALSGKQGQILYVKLKIADHPVSVVGTWHDRHVPFFRISDSEVAGLVGIDMADKPGTADFIIEINAPEATRQQSLRITIVPEDFREQRLTLPKAQVDPDVAALKRIAAEREQVKTVFASSNAERLWEKGFVVPLEGVGTGAFGSRRILNGQPRNQHTGEDIAAPLGTPVKATNTATVRLVDDHFFSGVSVILDHGLGLYTMYAHLHTAAVKEGDRVQRGDVIGTVGKSGRATGPHLHWGVWLNGSRVNPFSLTKLPIDSTP